MKISKAAEEKEHLTADSLKEMARETLGDELPPQQAEEIAEAMGRFAERSERRPRTRRRYGAPCLHIMLDGTRCKQRGWLGGEYCFQHDPETAELRRLAGRPSKRRLTKGQEVEELVEETLREVRAGRMKPGQAYAVGYLAQLMLAARASRLREVKLDVKWFWDMADLAIAFENGEKSLKEKKRKAREEKKARKAREAKKAREAEPFVSEDEVEGGGGEETGGEAI